MKSKSILLIFFILLSFIATPVYLLAVTESGTGSNITTDIKPTDPRPGETVTITLSGYGFNTNQAYYQWFKNGKKTQTGTGASKYSFQLGQLGTPAKINVIISSNGRQLGERSFYFEPTDMDLTWEAETYTPPFYQGKARATAGTMIKILATPYIINQEGKLESANQLTYTWSQNGKVLENYSGLGKKTLVTQIPQNGGQFKITVKALTKDRKISASGSLILNLNQPEIVFYKQEPLTGANYLKQVVSNYELYSEEVSFQALPLFWPLNSIDNLSYSWKVNSITAKSGLDQSLLTVRQPSGGTGQNAVSLQITDKQTLISNNFNIKFGNNLLKFNNPQ